MRKFEAFSSRRWCGTLITEKHMRLQIKRSYVAIGIGALLIAAAIGFMAYAFLRPAEKTIGKNTSDSDVNLQTVCTSAHIETFNSAYGTHSTSELLNLAGDIKKQPSYENDINCVYMMTEISIAASDPTHATQYLSRLEKLELKTTSFSEMFKYAIRPVDQMKQDVASLVSAGDSYKKIQGDAEQGMNNE